MFSIWSRGIAWWATGWPKVSTVHTTPARLHAEQLGYRKSHFFLRLRQNSQAVDTRFDFDEWLSAPLMETAMWETASGLWRVDAWLDSVADFSEGVWVAIDSSLN
jgi:hypothetical protein